MLPKVFASPLIRQIFGNCFALCFRSNTLKQTKAHWIHLHEIYKGIHSDRRQISGCRSCGDRDGDQLWNDHGVYFGDDENARELKNGDGCSRSAS